jgi:hypothetical protein
MLRIRSEQMEVFRPVAEEAFIIRVAEHLRDNHADVAVQVPDRVLVVKQISEEMLHEMVRRGLARARQYGMNWESSLTAFVVLMFVAAPNFDRHALVQRVLKDERVEANSRIDQLWEKTSEENWQAVKENYDVAAWELGDEEVSDE